MKHITILEDIFKSLQDLSTISGVEIILDEKPGSRLISLTTKRQTKIEIRKEETHFVAYMLREKLVNYYQKIDEFYQQFFDYLNNSQPDMRNAIFEMVFDKLNAFRLKMSLPAVSDYWVFKDDIDLLINKNELNPDFKIEDIYDLLTKRREIEREGLLNFIEQKVTDLQNGIEENNLPTIQFRSKEQKISWLFELGILDAVMNKCKNDDGITYNWRTAARIINSIMPDLPIETVRKDYEFEYQPGSDKNKSPMRRKINIDFVKSAKQFFGIK